MAGYGAIEPSRVTSLSAYCCGLQLLGEIKQRRPDLPVMMVTA
jgi:hypothetical protein